MVKKSIKYCAYWGYSINNPVSKNNTSLWICIELHISQTSLSDPYCYTTLCNHFHKSNTSIKVITSINSKNNMYQFRKDELSADYLLNNLILFDDEPPLKDLICLNLPELP